MDQEIESGKVGPSAEQLIPIENERANSNSTEVNEEMVKVEVQANVQGTVGGTRGHIARRVYHVIVFGLAPILFFYLDDVADALDTTCVRIISVLCMIAIVMEALRLKLGVVLFAMREYEKKVISAQFWGTFGVSLIMLAAPYRPGTETPTFKDKVWIGAPIIWSLGAVDPLIGELKHKNWGLVSRSFVGGMAALIIFVISCFTVDTPWWFCLIYPEMIVLAEYAGGVLRVDDNGLMLILPLLMTYVFLPWM